MRDLTSPVGGSPTQVMSGSLRAPRGGRPKTSDGHRVCVEEECETVLSRYNHASSCRVHAMPTFPRVRGVSTA